MAKPAVCRAPDVDHEVRWCILKLADILIRGVEETPPKVTIHLPPTPVAEVAPQLPAVKVKAPRPSKSSVPPPKAPLVPAVVSNKLKLALAPADSSTKTPRVV